MSFDTDLGGVNKIQAKLNQWDPSVDQQTQQKRDLEGLFLPDAFSNKMSIHCWSPTLVWGSGVTAALDKGCLGYAALSTSGTTVSHSTDER